MKVLGDNIHAVPLERTHSTRIHMSEEARRHLEFGVRVWRVISTGPGRRTRKGKIIPVVAKPGERVITNFEHGGNVVLKDGTSVFSEQHVLGVLPPL